MRRFAKWQTLAERVEGLRTLGYSDEQIVDVLVHAAEPSLRIQEAPLRELLERMARATIDLSAVKS